MAERALSESPFLDPTTAVQALDRLHDGLRQLVRRQFPDGCFHDSRGQLRLTVPVMDWDAYVHLVFEEIRIAGRRSPQVTRRLMAVFDDLLEIAPPARRAAIVEQAELLRAGLPQDQEDGENRAFAMTPDAQGIGVASRNGDSKLETSRAHVIHRSYVHGSGVCPACGDALNQRWSYADSLTRSRPPLARTVRPDRRSSTSSFPVSRSSRRAVAACPARLCSVTSSRPSHSGATRGSRSPGVEHGAGTPPDFGELHSHADEPLEPVEQRVRLGPLRLYDDGRWRESLIGGEWPMERRGWCRREPCCGAIGPLLGVRTARRSSMARFSAMPISSP